MITRPPYWTRRWDYGNRAPKARNESTAAENLMAMRNSITSWARAVLAGFIGTTAMSSTLWAERRARHHLKGPVDYDASSHVVQAASTLLHINPDTDRQRRVLFLLVHWGYGSAVGVGYRGVRAAVGSDVLAAAIFYAGCQSMTFLLFPRWEGHRPRGGGDETC